MDTVTLQNSAREIQPSANGDGPECCAIVRRLADVPRTETVWLWPSRIPCGTITLLDGDPGLGKSWITLDIAARLTRGNAMPQEADGIANEPGDVLLLSAEDDLARTIRPRLEAMRADLHRVHCWDEVQDGIARRPPILPGDLELLLWLVQTHHIRLIVIDPLMAYLSGEIDAHKDSDIRRLMFGLRLLAERTGAAIVIVRHLTKLVSVSEPLYRGGGSIGIMGAARSALMVARHPGDPERRLLARPKGNLSAEPPTLEYRITAEDDGPAVLQWLGPVDLAARDMLAGSRTQNARQKTEQKLRDAISRLLGALDSLDPDRQGAGLRRVRGRARISGEMANQAVEALLADGRLQEVEVMVSGGRGSKQPARGIRRPPA